MADSERDFNWIKETEQDFQPLFRRMDADADLYNQLEYQLKDLETNKISKDVVNVTMNDPKVFADTAQAFMNEASMQTIAEGKRLSDKETSLIEHFDADMRYEIDSRLMLRDISSLYSFAIEQSCIRGTVAGRYVSWEKDEQFVPDLLPCDSRYLVYEYGDKDLDRAAFKTIRSRASILAKYPNADIDITAKRGAIREECGSLILIWMLKKVKSSPNTRMSLAMCPLLFRVLAPALCFRTKGQGHTGSSRSLLAQGCFMSI